MKNLTEAVKQLLIINVLFFIGTQIVGDGAYKFLAMYFPENENFHFWQIITHMFMHGGFMHIFFNMFALYSFGSVLENIWGTKKFVFFYISCGLGAALLHTGVNYYFFNESLNTLIANGFSKTEVLQLLNEGKINTQWQELLTVSEFQNFTGAYMGTVVGASGAIYGLLVAFAFMFPNAELALMFIPVPIKAKYFVPIWMLLYDGFFGILGNSFMGIGQGVAHYAHIGGAITGLIMVWIWKKNQFNNKRWN
ncbi:membrane associated rhomboid family serine protease [Flavobacterium sp. 7E]|uniref:rhomboid family intramembrane serine protease n=1 Tax=unclassified Flavobacterium TaxID=196869 RepID=UPI00156F3F2A|nr:MULTISPECIES: rhomboid family intramembrane serine protease [unclassified Flavobacterium]MBE0391032.1 Rhomboid protease GlpG [Flavobacterium sp. PL002]NRS89256.1 membrane associated rhomboid family serine protease [Flavobacterium sp. 7E]NRT15244.1 membrane associated rhomboid family serine protease [Flavobacterium sp. 28A]